MWPGFIVCCVVITLDLSYSCYRNGVRSICLDYDFSSGLVFGGQANSGEHKKLAQLLDKLIERVIVRADCIYVDLRPLPMFQQRDAVVLNGVKAAPTGIEPVFPP